MEFRAILDHARPYSLSLILVVLLSLLAALTRLVLPWLAARLLSGLLNDTSSLGDQYVALIASLLAAALLMLTLIRIANGLYSSKVATRIEADFKRSVYAHVQRLPMSFFDQGRQGDLLALLTWEVSRLSAFISQTLTSVPAALMTCCGALLILFLIDPVIALIVPLLLPAYYISLKLIGRRLRGLATRVQEAEAEIFASAEEDIEMIPAIKSFAREDNRFSDYARTVENAQILKLQELKIYALLGPTISFVTALAAVGLLVAIGGSLEAQRIDATGLFSFLLYAALLTGPVGSLANLYGQFNTARGTLKRLHGVLQQSGEEGYQNSRLPNESGTSITFRNVTFAYPDRDATLGGLTFEIQPGEIVALTGANGAGKTSTVMAIIGVVPVASGTVSIFGQDMTRATPDAIIRAGVAISPEGRRIFASLTVEENLILAGAGAGDPNTAEARRAALMERFSILGERRRQLAGLLSGGEQQMLAVARALIGAATQAARPAAA